MTDLPQRYYDALEHPMPGVDSFVMKAGVRLFAGGNVEPTTRQMEAYGRLMMRGDTEADAWAHYADDIGRQEWFRIFHKAVDNGLDGVKDAPEPLRMLLQQTEDEPIWLDRRVLDIGCRVAQRMGNAWGRILGNLALLGGYYSGAIVKPLIFTGALKNRTDRRLQETAQFTLAATRTGNLENGKPGYTSALRVRLMHGLIRKGITDNPEWRSDLWGVPINQADMINTNLAFSFVTIIAGRQCGFRFSDEEVKAHLHLWRYIGYLMGIDQRQLPTTEVEAWRIFYLGMKLTPPPDADSKALAEAYREDAYGRGDSLLGKVQARVDRAMTDGFARFLMPPGIARALEIPLTPWMLWPLPFVLANFGIESMRLRVPGGQRIAAAVGDHLQRKAVADWIGDNKADFVPDEGAGEKKAA